MQRGDGWSSLSIPFQVVITPLKKRFLNSQTGAKVLIFTAAGNTRQLYQVVLAKPCISQPWRGGQRVWPGLRLTARGVKSEFYGVLHIIITGAAPPQHITYAIYSASGVLT
jgi:hypothetical protein